MSNWWLVFLVSSSQPQHTYAWAHFSCNWEQLSTSALPFSSHSLHHVPYILKGSQIFIFNSFNGFSVLNLDAVACLKHHDEMIDKNGCLTFEAILFAFHGFFLPTYSSCHAELAPYGATVCGVIVSARCLLSSFFSFKKLSHHYNVYMKL